MGKPRRKKLRAPVDSPGAFLVPGPAIGVAAHWNVIDFGRLVVKVHRLVGAAGGVGGFPGGNRGVVPGCRLGTVNRCLLMFEGSQLSIRAILSRSRAGVPGGGVMNRGGAGGLVRWRALQCGIDGMILTRAQQGILGVLILSRRQRSDGQDEQQDVETFHERSALRTASEASHKH